MKYFFFYVFGIRRLVASKGFYLSGRFKSKETDISRHVNLIFMFFMSKNSKHSVVLEYILIFTKLVFLLSSPPLIYTKCEERYYFHRKKYVCLCPWYLKNYRSDFHENWTALPNDWILIWDKSKKQGCQKFPKISVFDCCFIVVISKKKNQISF